MSSEFKDLRLEQLQAATMAYAPLLGKQAPSRGWLREIRESLGRTQRQQAERLGISSAALHKNEKSEADERITLAQLRKMANCLECDLVYALVPRRPLIDIVRGRAEQIAQQEVFGVAHSMDLEDQRPGDERIRKQVQRRADELLRGKWSALWR